AAVSAELGPDGRLWERPDVAGLSAGNVETNRLEEHLGELRIVRAREDRVPDFGFGDARRNRELILDIRVDDDSQSRKSLGEREGERILREQSGKALLGPRLTARAGRGDTDEPAHSFHAEKYKDRQTAVLPHIAAVVLGRHVRRAARER